ncbi:MAG TPA: hypothetical protein PLF85_07285 [Turneriella sp.]|nr:hypothetical protein [Turneriella sp.]
MVVAPIHATKEWEVIFNEGQHWRIGIYRPKYRARDEIAELEQHTCPEAFLLLKGELTMLYRDASGALHEKQLSKGELVTFSEPHAGFSANLDGVAFVVENAKFETVYTDVTSGQETRRVSV